MQEITLNLKKITIIREALQLPLFELFQHMNHLGWDSKITMPDEHFGSVYFTKRDEWNDRPILASRCAFGYHFETATQDIITSTARRAAELCLTVYETFGKLIPSNPNIHGEIRADPIANKSQYSNITYTEFLEKHKDKQLRLVDAPSWRPDGFYLHYYGYCMFIAKEDELTLLNHIVDIKPTLSGEHAAGI